MMANAIIADWIAETTDTVGTGNINLTGRISGFLPFSTIGNKSVYYTIQESLNREIGIGLINVSTSTLTRQKVIATIKNGVYSTSNIPLSLKGRAEIFCTITADLISKLVPIDRTINGKSLDSDITLTFDDIGSGEYVKKAGDEMSGPLSIKVDDGFPLQIYSSPGKNVSFKGYRGVDSDFYFGRPSNVSDFIAVFNYSNSNSIQLKDDGSILYAVSNNQYHMFNATIKAPHFITTKGTYPSVRVSGDKGFYGSMELDSNSGNLNLMMRDDANDSNRNIWYFKNDGYVKSNKGFETDSYTENNTYANQYNTGAPFYVGALTNKTSSSAYFPAVKWKSKPSPGKWLTSSIGHILNGDGISATVLASVDEGGKDQVEWSFYRNGDFLSPANVIAYSDIRVKSDIKEIPNALEKVKSIRGVTYTRTDTGARQAGVIAQEVEKVLPEVISTNRNESANIDDFKSVAYGNMVSILIEAIKELDSKVDTLAERLSKYEDV